MALLGMFVAVAGTLAEVAMHLVVVATAVPSLLVRTAAHRMVIDLVGMEFGQADCLEAVVVGIVVLPKV